MKTYSFDSTNAYLDMMNSWSDTYWMLSLGTEDNIKKDMTSAFTELVKKAIIIAW